MDPQKKLVMLVPLSKIGAQYQVYRKIWLDESDWRE
jgi:hypothetical protein